MILEGLSVASDQESEVIQELLALKPKVSLGMSTLWVKSYAFDREPWKNKEKRIWVIHLCILPKVTDLLLTLFAFFWAGVPNELQKKSETAEMAQAYPRFSCEPFPTQGSESGTSLATDRDILCVMNQKGSPTYFDLKKTKLHWVL